MPWEKAKIVGGIQYAHKSIDIGVVAWAQSISQDFHAFGQKGNEQGKNQDKTELQPCRFTQCLPKNQKAKE